MILGAILAFAAGMVVVIGIPLALLYLVFGAPCSA